MKISDANNIYVGSNQAAAVYLGSTQIWPERTWYVDYSTMLNGGWGSQIIDYKWQNNAWTPQS